jgi:multisubunit Na+/H+ antiporter MnhG subunit
MLDLLELLFLAPEVLVSWRLLVGALVVVLLCWIVFANVPDSYTRWLLCTPIVVVGIVASFRWQMRSMSER